MCALAIRPVILPAVLFILLTELALAAKRVLVSKRRLAERILGPLLAAKPLTALFELSEPLLDLLHQSLQSHYLLAELLDLLV